MKKIAFYITSTGWGGLEMNTLKLACLLKARGWNVTLITRARSKIYDEGKNCFSAVIILENVFILKNARSISNLLKTKEIETVLVFNNPDIAVLSFVKQLFYRKLNIVYQQHMQIGINKRDLIHTLRYLSINYWVSPLNWLKQEIIQKTKYPESRIKVVPIGVKIDRFITPKYTKETALQQLGISPKGPLIGIIGRIDPQKGQDFLIDCMKMLKEKEVNAELLIFGSPTINDTSGQVFYERLKQTIADHSLQTIIHFCPYQAEVELFYNAIDIFALASRSETYGMVTIEAMLAKLPIVATNSGGSPEILGHGQFGQLYEYGNINSFCEKVTWALNNITEAKALASAAKQNAIANYTDTNEVMKIEGLLNNLYNKSIALAPPSVKNIFSQIASAS